MPTKRKDPNKGDSTAPALPKTGPPVEAAEPDADDKPTIIPQFDPEAFAKEVSRDHAREDAASAKGTMPPPAEYRPHASTVTDEAELESARQLSVSLTGPPPPDTTQMPESVRASLLSMADARASIVPSGRKEAAPWTSMDKAWEELTLDDPVSEEPPTKPSGPDVVSPFGEKPQQERTVFKAAAVTKQAKKSSDEFTVWAPGKSAAAAAALAPESRPTPIPAAAVPDPAPESATGPISRAEPAHPADAPEHTVFAPARAAAALTASVGPPSMRNPASTRNPAETPGLAVAAATSAEDETIREMRDRFSLGDYTGALVLAEGLLEDLPTNIEVAECAESCRAVLRQMYTARIGPLDRVPVVTVARDQLRWLSIDHRAGFVLSHIDGISSLEMILDVSGMPLLDALRILCELAQQRIISFR